MSDPSYSYVALLLHCNGTEGSPTFTDSSPTTKTVTANGSAVVKTDTVKFGTGSALGTGSGAYLSSGAHADFLINLDDFTIEGWVYITSFAAASLQGFFNVGAYNTGVLVRLASSNIEVFTMGSNNNFATTISTGAWHHIAVSRVSGTIHVFVDGTRAGSATANTTNITADTVRIGVSTHNSAEYIDGRYDDVRYTVGVGRYSANFTAPSAAFSDASPVFSGNITEALAITDWRVSAVECATGVTKGTATSSGTTYSVNVSTDQPCIITLSPKVDYAWSASKVAALDDLVVASNPDATSHLWKVTTAGTFASTEATWNLSGTTAQGTATLTYVGPLVDPVALGPKIPS